MFHILTAVLIVGLTGGSDDLQNIGGLGREPDIQTISSEVIMTAIAIVVEHQPADRRKPQDVKDNQRRDAAPNGDVLMERIFEKMNTTPQEEVLKRIASLPDIRQSKVLRIRRQVTNGTYQVIGRLDDAIDRILGAITG